MRCTHCKRNIAGSYYNHPLFDHVSCEPCGSSYCDGCGRRGPVKRFFNFDLCIVCGRESVTDTEDLVRLAKVTVPIIEHHFGPTNYGHLPIIFGPEPPYLGQAWYSSESSHIRMAQGLPFGYAVGVLAHEYGHMILNLEPTSLDLRPHHSSRERIIEEGFCEVLNALALLTQSTDSARWLCHKISLLVN